MVVCSRWGSFLGSLGVFEKGGRKMNADRVPFRSEVMAWSPQQLADYLKRRNLSGCDKAVLKNSISGSRFVNLSDIDLEKFPRFQAPLISKISTEISKKEGPSIFRKKPSRYHEPDTAAEVQGWDEDEFDDEDFDDDYENPDTGDEEGSVGDYESPIEESEGLNDYEPPPSEPSEDHLQRLCPTLPIGDGDYIDKRDLSRRGSPPAVCPRPPVSTISPRMQEPCPSRRDPSPHSSGRTSGKISLEPPQIFRCNKPGRDSGPNKSPIRGSHLNTGDRGASHPWKPQPDVPDLPTWSKPPILPPSNTSVSRNNSSARPPPNRFDIKREQTQNEAPKHNTFPLHNKSLPPRPAVPSRPGNSLPLNISSGGSLPPKPQSALNEQRGSLVDRQLCRPPPSTAASTQELDPRWYVGKVTRSQAEGCLKQLHKDGAYLVRDSTKQLPSQPYTLMVLYQDKVYNIQIRQENQQFLLGTGLKVQEAFPSVSDIIGHYSHCPLLLIDAKNRNSSQHNQCLLSDPAGYHTTQQNWS
ncbi:lymphocyte cytosolic protein 2a isoform X2 [Antennarius striatus]|uniref:lymphocyte cytosolic protein 2a isoform X2 n=1 Tax=Antennarius striatus TaxID=241820 RepID=UPI0035B2A4AD